MAPRKLRRLPTFLTLEEYQQLVAAMTGSQPRLCLRLMFRCGLRVSEAVNLRRDDLMLNRQPRPCIRVRADSPGNKSRRERLVPVPTELVPLLQDRVSDMGRGERASPLFNITRQAVSVSMKKAGADLGLDGEKCRPHAARHGYGRLAALAGVPLPVLSSWMGHADLRMVSLYTRLAGEGQEWVDTLALALP